MTQIYFLIFWIPAIASVVMLFVAGQDGLFSNSRRLIVWFAIALLFQIVGGKFSPAWTLGLVLQAVLAIYLAIRLKLG